MPARAIQPASVKDLKRLNPCKLLHLLNIVKVSKMEALAKFVPAAAVKRIEQVLFIGTRLKALLGGSTRF